MPPPKGLSGELASEFSKLFGKVSARSVPLEGEAATKAVQNLTQQGGGQFSPELQVAFDELLEKGAKLEEVTGTGVGAGRGGGPLWHIPDYRAGKPPYMDPEKAVYTGYNTQSREGAALEEGQINAATLKHTGTGNVDEVFRNVTDAQLSNINHPNYVPEDSAEAAASPVGGWPRAWTVRENIPAILTGIGGAGLAAAILTPNRSEAAPFKPNRVITQLSGPLGEQFQRLATKLEARTGPLSAEGAAALQRLSPEQQVALDEALSGGAKLGEVTGTGTPRYETGKGWVDSDAPLWIQRDGHNQDVTTQPDIGPRSKTYLPPTMMTEQDVGRLGQAGGAAITRNRETGQLDDLQYQAMVDARERTVDAMYENTAESSVSRDPGMWTPESIRRGHSEADSMRAPNSRVGDWPSKWLDTENIPGILTAIGGAGLAAAVLAPGKAEAGPYKPNRNITKLVGAESDLFSRLMRKLQARTGELSPEGAAALQRLSPEQQVALDEALSGGAKLGEVSGTSAGWGEPNDLIRPGSHFDNRIYGQADLARQAEYNRLTDEGVHPNTAHVASQDAFENTGDRIDEAAAFNDEISSVRDPRVWNADSTARGWPAVEGIKPENARVGAWPEAWRVNENIPQVVGGAAALGAAAALAPGQAQAQSNEDLQLSDGRTMAPAGARPAPKPPPLLARPDELQLSQPSMLPPPERIEQGGQVEHDPTYTSPTGNERTPLEQAVAIWERATMPVRKFKQKHINPIIRNWQEANQRDYFGGASDAERMEGMPARGIGGFLRDQYPGAAYTIENAGKVVLGDTQVNKPGSEHKTARFVQDKVEQKFGGPTNVAGMPWSPAAYHQALLQGMSNLPFYLIPGVGNSAIMQGATGGFLSSLPDPEADPITSTVAGGVLGGGFAALGKGAGLLKAGAQEVKAGAKKLMNTRQEGVTPLVRDTLENMSSRPPTVKEGGFRSEMDPIAVLPPDEVGKLVDSVNAMPASPRDTLSDPMLGIIDADRDGNLVQKVLSVAPDGSIKAQNVTRGELPRNLKIIASDSAKHAAERMPDGIVAKAMKTRAEDAAGKSLITQALDTEAGDLFDLYQKQMNGEGLAVVVDWNANGKPKVINVDSPELKKSLLRKRQLIEVELRDGSKHIGFFDRETNGLRPPAPDEGIPNAAPAPILFEGNDQIKGVRQVNQNRELDEILKAQAKVEYEKEVALARAVADQQVAQADMALGGNGSGGKLPPPPPSDPPPPPPPNPHNVDPSEEIKLKWSQTALGGAYAKIQRKLLNPTVRGPQDLADLAFVSHSVDAFQRLAPDTLRQLQKTVPELAKMPPAKQRIVQQDISRYITGEIELETLRRAHPELNHQLTNALESHKAQIAADEAKLIELGMVAPDARSREAELLTMPEFELDYAVRMHWRYLMPKGEWFRLKSKDEAWMNQMIKKIRDAEYPGGGPDNLARAKTHLNYLLGDPKLDTPVHKAQYGAGAKGSLKEREVMPAWKSEALGPVPGMFRVAETRARQKQLIVLGEMYKSAAENRNLAVRGDDPFAEQLGYTVPVPQDRRYGLLAGMKVKPEAWEALVEAPAAQRNASHWIRSVSNFFKYNQTVANPGSWVTNFLANMQGAALSNLVSPWAAPTKLGKGMHLFTQDLKAFKAAPGLKGRVPSSMVEGTGEVGRARFERATELGIIASDYSTAEFHNSASDWARIIDAEVKQHGTFNPLNVLSHAGSAKDWLAKKYGAIDSLWKYATYTAGLQKAGFNLNTGELDEAKAIKFLTPSYVQQVWHGPGEAMGRTRYRPGMLLPELKKQVELEVAQRIHYSFPMLDRVGEGVAAVGQYGGTAINPYLKIKTELMRNYAQLPARILREPGMMTNLMSYAATVAGIYYGIREMRAENGVNQEEVDQSFMAAPPAVKRFKPGAMAMWRRTADGRLTYVDLTALWEPFSWLQGDPNAAVSTRFLTNLAMTPVDGSLVDPEVAALLNQSGILNTPLFTQEHPEWQQGGALLTQKLMERVLPGLMRNTYSTAVRGGLGFAPKGLNAPDAVPQSPLTTGLNMVLGPNRVFETGSPADKKRAIQQSGQEIDRAAAELDRIGRMNQGQSTGIFSMPFDKKEAIQKAKDVVNEKKQQHKQLKKDLGR